MIYLLPFLLLPLLSMADSPTDIVCVFNASLPPYQPNIYLCSSSSLCCVTRLQPACCERDVTAKQMLIQSIPFVIALFFFLLLAAIISWYLNDAEIEDEAMDENAFKRKTNLKNVLFPSNEDDVVDDPIFGRVWDEKAPRYSRVPERAKPVGYLVEGGQTKKNL